MAEGVTEKQQCVGHGKKAAGRGETCDFTGAVREDARLWEEDIWADRMHPGRS